MKIYWDVHPYFQVLRLIIFLGLIPGAVFLTRFRVSRRVDLPVSMFLFGQSLAWTLILASNVYPLMTSPTVLGPGPSVVSGLWRTGLAAFAVSIQWGLLLVSLNKIPKFLKGTTRQERREELEEQIREQIPYQEK